MRYMNEDLAAELYEAIDCGTEEPYTTELEGKIRDLMSKDSFQVIIPNIETVEQKHLVETRMDAIFAPSCFARVGGEWQTGNNTLTLRYEEYSPETVCLG